MSNICTRFIFKPLIINIYCLLQVCLIKKKWWTDLRLLCILFWSLTTLLCSYAPLETELQIGIYITHRKNPNLLFNYCALVPLKKRTEKQKDLRFIRKNIDYCAAYFNLLLLCISSCSQTTVYLCIFETEKQKFAFISNVIAWPEISYHADLKTILSDDNKTFISRFFSSQVFLSVTYLFCIKVLLVNLSIKVEWVLDFFNQKSKFKIKQKIMENSLHF